MEEKLVGTRKMVQILLNFLHSKYFSSIPRHLSNRTVLKVIGIKYWVSEFRALRAPPRNTPLTPGLQTVVLFFREFGTLQVILILLFQFHLDYTWVLLAICQIIKIGI